MKDIQKEIDEMNINICKLLDTKPKNIGASSLLCMVILMAVKEKLTKQKFIKMMELGWDFYKQQEKK